MRTWLYVSVATALAFSGCRTPSPSASTVQSGAQPPATPATPAPVGEENPACVADVPLASLEGVSWQARRDACEANLARHLQAHQQGYESFDSWPLGRGGIPLILLKLLPEIDPETWGKPEENFARFGFFFDERRPKGPFPHGLTWSRLFSAEEIGPLEPNFDVVTLSCGACHVGRVRLDNGSYAYIDGGVNTQLDINQFRSALSRTLAKHDGELALGKLALKITKLVLSKPVGFFYGGSKDYSSADEMKQRALFSVTPFVIKLLKKAKVKIALEKAVMDKRVGTSYGVDAGWKYLFGGAPGSVDAIGNTIYRVVGQQHFGKPDSIADVAAKVPSFKTQEFEAVPKEPTPADFMSIWGQSRRAVAQWNGDLKNTFWRNIAAQLGVIGEPANVDLTITAPAAVMMHRLPPKPYPFDVDMGRAVAGEKVFKDQCASCHRPMNDRVYDVGTDFKKAKMVNPAAAKVVLESLQAVCKDPNFTVKGVDGEDTKPCALAPNEILVERAPEDIGYAPSPLDGIWARAPYLHNGSVPTLRAMLIPSERPDVFVRGAIGYDQENVGWNWRVEKLGEYRGKDLSAAPYDSRLAGFGHQGHDRNIEMNGKTYVMDWGGPEYAEDVKNLLEYLKTL